MSSSPRLPFSAIALGLAHASVDAATASLLVRLVGARSPLQVGLAVLVFNALSSGAQLFLGPWIDRRAMARGATIAGMGAVAAAVLLAAFQPEAAVVVAGVGSAAFHVGAGALALGATPDRAAGPALFSAPGIVGLALGAAYGAHDWMPVAAVAALVLLLLPVARARPLLTSGSSPTVTPPTSPDEGYDLVIVVLVGAVAIRSAIWNGVGQLLPDQPRLVLVVAAAAGLGKLLGGAVADRVGWRPTMVGALLGAGALLSFGTSDLVALAVGVALLQSAIPATMTAIAARLPGRPATAASLALGTAILVGGLPLIAGMGSWPARPWVVTALAGGAALTCWLVLAPNRGPTVPS